MPHAQAVMTFNLEADLRSVFSWNTKQLFVYLQAEYETPSNKINQIVLWDAIIEEKVFHVHCMVWYLMSMS